MKRYKVKAIIGPFQTFVHKGLKDFNEAEEIKNRLTRLLSSDTSFKIIQYL